MLDPPREVDHYEDWSRNKQGYHILFRLMPHFQATCNYYYHSQHQLEKIEEVELVREHYLVLNWVLTLA